MKPIRITKPNKPIMKNNLKILVAFVLCAITTATIAQTNDADARIKRLDSIYSALHAADAFNGNVLIAEKGKVIFEKSYGLANEKTGAKLNANTIFELASVSKQFTAMGIVLLKKQGKLSYEDDITKYIPELADYKGITVQNLLVHTGGLPDYMDLAIANWDKNKIATNNDILNLFQTLKPKKAFETNEKWQYSNTGYLILGSIIERVSGQSFGEFLKQYIFQPLDMKHSLVYRSRYQPQKIENYALAYGYSDSLKRKITADEMGRNMYVFLDGIVGDGMVNTTAKDLLKWDRALYTNKLVDEEDKKMIFSSYPTNDNKGTNYGFGWFINNSKDFGKRVYHSGSWAGYITYIERDLDHDKTIIILQNNMLKNTEIPSRNTRRILYGLPIEKK